MSKAEQEQQIETLSAQLQETQRERDEYRVCEKIAREELDDAQRENLRLRGWQDCAREILSGTRSVVVK